MTTAPDMGPQGSAPDTTSSSADPPAPPPIPANPHSPSTTSSNWPGPTTALGARRVWRRAVTITNPTAGTAPFAGPDYVGRAM
mmetsp:Transcript_12150/g.15154  ORF Transcript_12150/g.15154 Transcript_12150/m.15154 type:complete len:83 (+) Transcript_12150:147-395(+)